MCYLKKKRKEKSVSEQQYCTGHVTFSVLLLIPFFFVLFLVRLSTRSPASKSSWKPSPTSTGIQMSARSWGGGGWGLSFKGNTCTTVDNGFEVKKNTIT